MAVHSARTCFWVFTVNNYETLLDPEEMGCKYLVYSEEVGESGTPHLQGYLEFETAKRAGGVLDVLPYGAHIEPRKGTAEQAVAYATKVRLILFIVLGQF